MKEMVGGCCVCSDERGWPDNPLVYCDGNGCTVAVHQGILVFKTVDVSLWLGAGQGINKYLVNMHFVGHFNLFFGVLCSFSMFSACYGIVTVPTGPWFCRKCESPETKNKVVSVVII